MPIVGTAGHVDHGKSALVAALTGTNPDRWIEERLRGMTLDLGFAHLVLEKGLEAGIVDVPGHERFLHNMLAGAAGMDVLLLVVAADEGVMPQTREHLDILRYLNVGQTILVVTKIDALPPAARDGAYASIASALRGTLADGAPLAAVSSVTGEGLADLRNCIAAALRALPPRNDDAPAYLPVDRVFALPGLGTIVTGTLMQGSVATGDVVTLAPSGMRARIRSIGVFGATRRRAAAGTRVALNLPGVDRHRIGRGEVVVSEGCAVRSSFAVRFTPLEPALPLLRRRTPVRAYLGAAEILGVLTFERAPDGAREVRAELHLREATVAFPGVRFVVRRPSPKTLLGGGFVEGLGLAPADGSRTAAESAVLAALRAEGFLALDVAAVARAANLREEIAHAALESLAARDDVLALRRPPAYVDGVAAREMLAQALEYLDEFARTRPWTLGATSIALARELDIAESLLVRVLAEFAENGRLASRSGYYATLHHQPSLTPEQRELFDRLVSCTDAQPFSPVPFADVATAVRRSAIDGADQALDTLLLGGALVKVGDDLYRGSQIASIRARLEKYLGANERITAAAFRDLLGTSRKYAVPLLEWLDAHNVTLRNGDYRTLRRHA
ncbi:MAG: selenocysteine-specific translation elongation factor [Candidatus Tumulicola sp.]